MVNIADYTKGSLEKKQFVEGPLRSMLRAATGGCAARLDYEVNGAEEYVIVRWKADPREPESFPVNVTADSLWGIAKDVMRAVAKHYE